VRELRRREGLGPGRNPLTEAKFSPDLVLALFSSSLAEAQPDWPASTVQPGFIFYDDAEGAGQFMYELNAFLGSGEAPIVFTQGSTAVHDPGAFYDESIAAARLLGRRALLIGAQPSPQFRGPDVFAAAYARYSDVFPRASAIVHQGGSGTTGQAMRAGRPMLFVPYGWEEPDNAARIERAGAGLTIPRKRYTAKTAAQAIQRLMADAKYAQSAAKLAAEIESEDAITAGCHSIESLLDRNRLGAPYQSR
jgi:UDP:flavonoid glycosyltransferase YjiC (YdhE family)